VHYEPEYDRQVSPHDRTVSSPLVDDVLEAGKIGDGDDLGVSDKIVPAYYKDRTLATHVEGLELP